MEQIDGVTITPLQQFSDYRGKVMKMMSKLDAHYDGRFGEIYFSVVHPGIVKGWHRHNSTELNYACIQGKILLVLYDDRRSSSTYGNYMEICLSPENYQLVHVPVYVVNGFKGLGTIDSIIADMASEPYDANEIVRLRLDYLKYDWFKRGE